MRLGLLKRIGLIVLAIAFLWAGFPRMALANAAATSTGVMTPHMHPGHVAHATSRTAPDCDPSGKSMPGCQHANDCLACVALDLPTGARLATALGWISLTYQPETSRLFGLTLRPELSPPIRQS
jgi:hypothetical protein